MSHSSNHHHLRRRMRRHSRCSNCWVVGRAVLVVVAALAPSFSWALSSLLSSSSPSSLDQTLPLARRQALLARSQQLNTNNRNSNKEQQSPLPQSWSNRAGVVLTPIHCAEEKEGTGGVYTADRPFYWNSIDVGCRMTVIEVPRTTRSTTTPTLSSTATASSSSTPPFDLFIHTPVDLDGPLMAALHQLGSGNGDRGSGTGVDQQQQLQQYTICAANYEHVKYANLWHINYPHAHMWACPGLMERMPEIAWRGEIPHGARPPGFRGTTSPTTPTTSVDNGWDISNSVLQWLHIDVEHNPFTGRPFFNEVIFYHVPTKTLLTTDLFWNYPASDGIPNSDYRYSVSSGSQQPRNDAWELAPRVDSIPFSSQAWKFGMDRVYAPFYNAFMITDREEYGAIAHHILNVWDVETVIPAHGDILRGKDLIRSVLTQAFRI